MKGRIESKGVASEKIVLVPPWAHDDQVRFDPVGREEFRAIHKLSDKFVVMYSGNHSPCHPLDTLLRAAEGLVDNENIVFCFVGGGSEFWKVQERRRNRGMHNVVCIPYQPIERLAASLSAADLQAVIVGNEYVGIVHPCKIYNVLAANRTFLYIGPEESHVRDIIRQDGRQAYISAHGDVDGVVANILNAMRRNETARPATVEFAKQFSKAVLIPKMISVIEESRA
jgi:glycosyltransferase involved in cell wall biosynthesis